MSGCRSCSLFSSTNRPRKLLNVVKLLKHASMHTHCSFSNRLTVVCETKRNEMVLCEMITGNCKIYCKRRVGKQIKSLLNKSVPESLRICKLVANYKATLVSNRNGFVFVSHGRREVFSFCVRRHLEIFFFLSQ